MKHRLALVPQEHIADVWLKSLPHIMNGKRHWEDFFSIEEIKRNLREGRQQLWVMIEGSEIEGVVITQIDEFSQKKILRISYLGGKGFKRSHMETLANIEEWAVEKGCSTIDILGRDEWYLLLKKHSYASPGRVYRKELKK